LPVPFVTTADGTLSTTLSDPDGDGIGDIPILLDGIPGQSVIVAVDGVFTGNMHVLTSEPIERTVRSISAGTHTIGIRYIDPVSQRVGRLETYTITVIPPAT
jgi:hypothetical protein